MQIELQEDTTKKVDKASALLGIKNQEFIDRAILVYLDNIEKHLALKKEMNEWEVLSDEALENFEKLL